MKLLGNLKKGLVFILSAPAGTGKTTLVEKALKEFPSVVQSISYTTRLPRPGEMDGVNYHFVSRQEFEEKIGQGEFLEYVELYGDYYGTSRKWVADQQNRGKHVILVIDTQGGLKLKKEIPSILIFTKPPSMEELRARLLKRKTESAEKIEQRLKWATKEIEEGRHYDYQIINDDLDVAYQVLKSILIAEEHHIRNITNNEE